MTLFNNVQIAAFDIHNEVIVVTYDEGDLKHEMVTVVDEDFNILAEYANDIFGQGENTYYESYRMAAVEMVRRLLR